MVEKNKPKRRYDLDWLRILAMLSIFLFHVARYFNQEDWHVKNPDLSMGATLFVGITAQWVMPLFFVISGMSTYYALGFRTKKLYITERFKRLLIPFLLGTFIILIPLQVWIERVSHGDFKGSFWKFYPHYFDGLYAFGGNFAWMGLHLWFLEFLFIFSIISLPLFLFFRKESPKRVIQKAAEYIRKRGLVFLLAIPLIVMELYVNQYPDGIGIRAFGGWSLATYLVLFILGYLLASNLLFKEAMENSRWLALVFVLVIPVSRVLGAYDNIQPGYFIDVTTWALGLWSWLIAIFGFGSRLLAFNNRYLKYGNEAVLPFYILHQTVIVFIGFQIIQWGASILLKYIFLCVSSFIIIIMLYEFTIRRSRIARFMFGMKPMK
ncbi:MAG: acyltransferase family protein [Candidatus Hodarchaeales archaeon]